MRLREWEALELPPSFTGIEALLRCARAVDVAPVIKGGFRVSARSIIGRMRVGDLDLLIEPKVRITCLLALLAEVHELVDVLPELAGYERSGEIVDLIVAIFLAQVEALVRGGLRRDYVELEEDLCAVRGRIDVARTMALHVRARPRVWCRHEDFVLDGPENRILLATLDAIAGTPALPARRRIAARLLRTEFPGVSSAVPDLAVADFEPRNRLTVHYRPALGLARLILRSLGLAQEFGGIDASGFLLDMSRLFEMFVARRLARILEPSRFQVKAQEGHFFADGEPLRIRPDIVVEDLRTGFRVVADTKYKQERSVDPQDLYQMLAYCRVLRVPWGAIIRVGEGPSRTIQVRDAATRIEVLWVSLFGEICEVERSILALAERLKAMLGRREGP